MAPLGKVTGDVLTQAVELPKEHTKTTPAGSCPTDKSRVKCASRCPSADPHPSALPRGCFPKPIQEMERAGMCAAPSQTRLPLGAIPHAEKKERGQESGLEAAHDQNPASLEESS